MSSRELPLTIEQARDDAAYAAAKEFKRLHVVGTQPVDVFGVIEAAGIWLFFSPLKDIQGAFLRNADTGQKAILVNSRRPLSMQRLTAAHEYGHYILEHEASLDDAADIEPSQTRIVQEAAAQVFANDFLMPPKLVQHLWKELGLPAQVGLIEPHQVYLLSLHLGVSYTALIFQLVALKKISRLLAGKLAKYQPRRIKQDMLGRNIGPVDSWADVWPLEEKDKGRHLNVRVNDELNVALAETPSTGYRWVPTEPEIIDLSAEISAANTKSEITTLLEERGSGGAELALLDDQFEGTETGNKIPGAGGRRFLKFRIMQHGAYQLRLGLRRPWMSTTIDDYYVTIDAVPKATGEQDNGVRENLKETMARSASLSDED